MVETQNEPAQNVMKVRQATSSDIVRLYQLAHNRQPESEATIAYFAGLELHTAVAAFFSSDEFAARVLMNAERGENIWGSAPRVPRDLIDWATEALPVSNEGLAALLAWADSWPGLYFALLSDPTFRSTAAPALTVSPLALASLKAWASLIASVERVDTAVVSGWAMARGPDAEPVLLEIWAGDAFVAAGRADRFRRDIQDLFGGDGRVGFEFRLDNRLRPDVGPVRVEVRIAASGERIGEGEVFGAPAATSGLSQLRAEIATVRATLERLERALPAATSGLGRPLADYGDYFEDWGRRAAAAHGDGEAIMVVLDAVGVTPLSLNDSARSLELQLGPRDRLTMLVDPILANTATEVVNRTKWRNGPPVSVLVSETGDPGARLREALAAEPGGDIVLLAQADTILAGDALVRIAAAFAAPGALQAVYADEDHFDPDDGRETSERRHAGPVFRPGYDRDLLLQTPYVGTTLAFRRSLLDKLPPADDCGGLHGPDLVLRLGDADGAVGHIASVLSTRMADRPLDVDGKVWARRVRAELTRQGREVAVEPKTDILGVVVPGAVRLRYDPGPVRVSVIIPTRDRMDLLRPCIESILRNRAENRVELDLIIVDHESREAETRSYLDALAAAGDARIMSYEGVFNWALMNNLAAAEARGQALIFLNNDTVVLSPDWIDELAGQCLRPEVGVVGARLLYEDGTIQHAGFVSRDANKDFLIHDGVGVPGSDGGYLGRHALLHSSPIVTGACMAVRTEVFRSLGGFDSANFPLEGNDADFCYRARAAGLSVIYDPYATLYHLESKSRGFSVSGEDRAASLAAQALLRARWGQRFAEDAGFNPHFDRTGRPFVRLRAPPANFPAA